VSPWFRWQVFWAGPRKTWPSYWVPRWAALLNATFGNAAELIIALMALARGPEMFPLVKASLTGSIIGNVLLVLGGAILAGGLLHKRQKFNRTAASLGATLLALACIGLVIPSIHYHLSRADVRPEAAADVERIREEIAVILAVTYGLSLVFVLRSHRDLITGREETERSRLAGPPEWSRRTSLVVLGAATVGVVIISEFLVSSVEGAAEALGMTPVFIGVILLAVIGNAAEHSTAVMMALKNEMDLAFTIAIGSGIQIALFVAPVLVLTSALLGHHPALDLRFTPMELTSIIIAIGVLALVSQDGESHWMEGVLLLAVYAMLALAFYHLPFRR
jgi:Ca2+:H+ antiporter